MPEYCPSCGTERTEQNDERSYCGAYVTKWEPLPKIQLETGEGEKLGTEPAEYDQTKTLMLALKIAIPLIVLLLKIGGRAAIEHGSKMNKNVLIFSISFYTKRC